MWSTRYVVRPVEDVVDEIEHWIARYGVTNVDFEDLTAFIKRDWILALCRELERRRIRVTYQLPSGTRSEALDREVLEALYRTGCRNLTYAPESGSVRTLTRIKKKVHLERMLDSMRVAVELGIVTKVNMIIGFPFETRRDVWATIKFCLAMAWIGVEDIPLFPFIAYPGSALHDELSARGAAPPLDNAFFASLGFSDLRRAGSANPHMSAREIALYRTAGMILFIIAGYLRHPSRVLRTARNLVQARQESAVEERLDQLLVQPLRRALGRPVRTRRAAAVG
jgi:hypothetical protein